MQDDSQSKSPRALKQAKKSEKEQMKVNTHVASFIAT